MHRNGNLRWWRCGEVNFANRKSEEAKGRHQEPPFASNYSYAGIVHLKSVKMQSQQIIGVSQPLN
jgi:hypothetical protein